MLVFTRVPVAAPGLAGGCDPVDGNADAEWLLRRNCCLTPGQLLASFGLISVMSTIIGAAFWMQGAPLVMPFVGLELLALGAALVVYARHADDGEKVSLRGAALTVEHRCAGLVERVDLRAPGVRIARRAPGELVELSAAGRRVAVGRYVTPQDRARFAAEFRDALRRA